MSTEENYLDNLLKAITEPGEATPTEEIIAGEELDLDALDISDIDPEVDLSDTELSDIEMHEVETSAVELPEEELSEIELPSAEDLVAEILNEGLQEGAGDTKLNIDGLDDAIQSATELELAGELDINDLGMEELNTEELDLGTDNDELKIDDLSIEDVSSNAEFDLDSDTGADGELSLDDVKLDVDDSTDGEAEIRAQEPPVDVETVEDKDALDEAPAETSDIDEDIDIPDIPDISPEESAKIAAELNINNDELPALDTDDIDDGLDDVLSMLDSEADSDLAEINDMLKKSDNNEPIQDDMMEMLHQMADNEAAFVNAGNADFDDSDEGSAPPPSVDVVKRVEDKKKQEDEDKKKKPEKAKKKDKKKSGEDNEVDVLDEGTKKEPGVLGRFFNMLTEDLVPEPTEEELEAEKEAKEAKKQENMTKKEAEKAEKAEAKKAAKEAKDAEKKTAAAAAEQKKKEQKAAKEAKKAAKEAKRAGEKPIKRIPPKKIAIGALFAATVCGAILIATNILASQGYIQKAKNAYYNGDYMTAYLSTYGMDLNASDDIIRGRSEVILKMQRKYDSYEINMKMGRELEALDALIGSLATYDYINTDAEQYGALPEVDAIKDRILNTLLVNYGLDEAAARELLQNDDALSYTVALHNIIIMN